MPLGLGALPIEAGRRALSRNVVRRPRGRRARASSKGPRSAVAALARTTEKAIRDQFGLLGDGLMHGQRQRLLEAVPNRARRVIEAELCALDDADRVPNLTEARQSIKEALRAGPLSLLIRHA